MASDSYPLKEVAGTVYEVDCAMIEVGGESIGEFRRHWHTCNVQKAVTAFTLLIQLNLRFCLCRPPKDLSVDNPHADIGANPSAEEGEEGLEDDKQKVNNVVHSFRLQSTVFDKKGYLSYLKGEQCFFTTTQQKRLTNCDHLISKRR